MLRVIFVPLAVAVHYLLSLAMLVVIVSVIMSWLIVLGVLNMSNPTVRQVLRTLDALTEPLYRRVRRVIPPVGNLDLSPLFVWLALLVAQVFFDELFAYLVRLSG
ncbi:MAG: YggT family protein [Rhizomicrobium sp.]